MELQPSSSSSSVRRAGVKESAGSSKLMAACTLQEFTAITRGWKRTTTPGRAEWTDVLIRSVQGSERPKADGQQSYSMKRSMYALFCLIAACCRAEKKMKWTSRWDPACSLGQGRWGIRLQEKEDRHLRESLSSRHRLAVIIGYLSRGVSLPHKEIWFQDLESWAPPHCPTSKKNKKKNEVKIYSY